MRYVALIRGINLGHSKRVVMADLRAVISNLGYTDVRTVLNSGNVILDAPAGDPIDMAASIEEVLAERLGVSTRATVLAESDLVRVVTDSPLPVAAPQLSRLVVAFLFDPLDRDKLEALRRQDWAPEALALGARAVYLWCANGTVGSPLVQAVERILGGALTFRTMGTVMRIQRLIAGPSRG